MRAALRAEEDFRDRLTAVLGVSAGLADHLARHPEDAELLRGAVARPAEAELRAALLRAVGADPGDPDPGDPDPGDPDGPVAAGQEPTAALAAAYRRRLLHLTARDLTGAVTVDEVGEELADIAAAVLEAALAVARAELPSGATPARLAVVAMGKCGGRELNYASDVDVIFVAEPVKDEDETAALATASRLAAGLIGVCARSTPEGSIFPVDPNLRPEGRAGPLVRTLASHLAYYERWAKTWEFQALLKARPVAGDMALGRAYAETLGPLVWQAARREHFVEDVQAMRRRVEQSLPARQAGARAQARPGRAARHRVRRPVAAARARPNRRDAALARHAARAGRAGRRRVRRPGRRRRARRRLPVPAPHRAPAPAQPAQPHPHPARGSRRTSQAGAGDAIQ